MSITITKTGNASVLSDGFKSAIVAPFGVFAITPRQLPLGGLQRRLFDSVKPDSISTKRKSLQSKSVSVLLHGVYVGEVRWLNGYWGWRTLKNDRTYASKEAAAIAYAKWAILNTWPNLCDRFEGVV